VHAAVTAAAEAGITAEGAGITAEGAAITEAAVGTTVAVAAAIGVATSVALSVLSQKFLIVRGGSLSKATPMHRCSASP